MDISGRVHFGKPDIEALKSEGYTCVDMHVHTKYSDGLAATSRIKKKLDRLGIGIAVCDHNFIAGSLELAKTDAFLIPGIEIEAKEGYHVLFYFYTPDELIRFYKSVIVPAKSRFHTRTCLRVPTRQVIDASFDFECVMVAAHPFGSIWQGIASDYHKKVVDGSLLKKFGAFEVICGESLHKSNLKSINLAELFGVGITGGSDGHTLREIGHVVTCAKADSVEEFLKAVKENKTQVHGFEIPMLRSIAGNLVKVKMAPFYPFPYLKRGFSYAGFKGANGIKAGFRKVKSKISIRKKE